MMTFRRICYGNEAIGVASIRDWVLISRLLMLIDIFAMLQLKLVSFAYLPLSYFTFA